MALIKQISKITSCKRNLTHPWQLLTYLLFLLQQVMCGRFIDRAHHCLQGVFPNFYHALAEGLSQQRDEPSRVLVNEGHRSQTVKHCTDAEDALSQRDHSILVFIYFSSIIFNFFQIQLNFKQNLIWIYRLFN